MIYVVTEECIDCGVCEPEFPGDAIKADTEPGLEPWLELNAEMARLWPVIVDQKNALPDADGWNGAIDKLEDFSRSRAPA